MCILKLLCAGYSCEFEFFSLPTRFSPWWGAGWGGLCSPSSAWAGGLSVVPLPLPPSASLAGAGFCLLPLGGCRFGGGRVGGAVCLPFPGVCGVGRVLLPLSRHPPPSAFFVFFCSVPSFGVPSCFSFASCAWCPLLGAVLWGALCWFPFIFSIVFAFCFLLVFSF